MSECLFVEACDFISYPPGGQLSFARQMMSAFGNRLALVGISIDQTPCGQWIKKRIDGVEYDFFAIGKRAPITRRPVIPRRLSAFLQLKLNKKSILSRSHKKVFINSPEAALAMVEWSFEQSCYCFHGVENPLVFSRYKVGRLFGSVFERLLFKAVLKAGVVLACSDDTEVATLVERSKGVFTQGSIVPFPTRVDTSVFRPFDISEARARLGITMQEPVFVVSGRLNTYKGWRLVLDAFALFIKRKRHGRLIFVGDGEDRHLLEAQIAMMELKDRVRITGFVPPSEVVWYLNAADIYVVGSLREGWSVAMLEALACGKIIVSTDVSGAKEMVREGENGLVIRQRDPHAFALGMEKALMLPDAQKTSFSIAHKYSLDGLRADMVKVWPALS